MLTGYFRLSQEGIEPLPEFTPPQKDKDSGHYYFDDFRISLEYFLNDKEKTSGVGILTFAPNGLLWSQSGEYCYEFNELASYYYALDNALNEAEKSKAKRIEIFVPHPKVVKLLNSKKPYKDKGFAKIHDYVKERFKKFEKTIVSHRVDYPASVKARLEKEAREAAEPPEISTNDRWMNGKGTSYFNVGATEAEEKLFAEQYARLMYDFMESYFKEYEQDYGKDALKDLLAKIKSGEIKEPPPLKRNIEQQKSSKIIKKFNLPNKKPVICQNCENEMEIEKCTLEMPENDKHFIFRCKKCLATKTLNGKGRVIEYGRYPKKKV